MVGIDKPMRIWQNDEDIDMQNGSQEYVKMKNYHEFHLGIRNPIPLNSKSNDLYDRVSVSKNRDARC